MREQILTFKSDSIHK
jgi:chromosome segregation ATPase